MLQLSTHEMPAALTTRDNRYIKGIGKRDNDRDLIQLIRVEEIVAAP